MGIVKEFRDFAFKGNMVDLAVGLIIGAAFGALVKSLVDKVMMPPLGVLIAGIDFSDLKVVLTQATLDEAGKVVKPAAEVQYGAFLTDFINFMLVAFAVFLLVRTINSARRRFEQEQKAAPPAGPSREEVLLGEIRDLLAMGRR